MDAKAVELETARIKSIMANAKHDGTNETIKQIMDFILSEMNKPLQLDQLYKFMFDLNSKASNYATETRNKYEEMRGDLFYGS